MSDIQSRDLIVKPTISSLGNTRTDDDITEEVRASHNMGKEAGRYVKNLYPPDSLKAIAKVAGEFRKWHKTQTIHTAFGDILPTSLFESYEVTANAYIAKFDSAADEFVANYDSILEAARVMHNGNFDPSLYPRRDLVRSEFSAMIFKSPMPRGRDVVVDCLASEKVAQLRDQLEREVSRSAEQASSQVMQRVLACVSKIQEKLGEPDAIFRDSLIENLRDVLEIAPALNIGNDPAVRQLVEECQSKLLQAPETLRQVATVRALAAAQAKNITLRFGAMGARKLAV